MKEQKKSKVIINIISIIIIIVALYIANQYINKYNFNEYVKSEYVRGVSEFTRDKDVKYLDTNSYKINSKEYNDAMFYKTIKVEKETPYKVTCMVKTDDVKTKDEVSLAGAHIAIADTTEKSKSITGTNDWQKIEFLFNSKNRESVNVAFRLGGYEDNCTGTVWFSDFTIESGIQSSDTDWKVALFIFENIDMKINKNGTEENIKLKMNTEDIRLMENNIRNFDTSARILSNGNMTSNSDIYHITEPITSISYDNENGYYVAPKDVENLIDTYIIDNEYDHIFVSIRLGDIMKKTEIPVNDWIGLRRNGLLWNWFFKYKTS